MSLHKEYHEVDGQTIKFSISFNRETRSWATGQAKKIGYQVTVLPVKRKDLGNNIVIEESGAFTGFNDCLLECERQSKYRLHSAKVILGEKREEYLNYFKKELA